MQMKATVKIIVDSRRKKDNGKYPVKLRITFNRQQKYYPLPFEYTEKDFERIMSAQRRNEEEKNVYKRLIDYESKAIKAADLPIFTFEMFENRYFPNRDAGSNIEAAFNLYIDELKEKGAIGTAVVYTTARNSICGYKPKVQFADVTPRWLERYETEMLKQGKSKTTISMYLRALRALFNRSSIDVTLYPFGDKKGKYAIPTSRNIKKALVLDEIAQILNYEAEPGSYKERSRDYWIFLYLCNGLNVKDLCLLKWKNIDEDVLRYERAKTSRSKKENSEIVISLKPQAKAVIEKYGQKSISPEGFVFPHLSKGMTAERQREVYQQLTQNINKNMKRIAKDLGINKPITTYYARHSFATVLKRSGASAEFISEALGHSDLKTTQSYLAGFETDTIHKTTDVLIPKAVNE